MSNDELHKLIGGYATGNLSVEERRALYQAALEDQALFDALGDEQPIKDLLDDPESRREIERALRGQAPPERKPWFARPWTWAAALGSVAAGAALVAILISPQARRPPPPISAAIARIEPPAPAPPSKAEPARKLAMPRLRSTKAAKARLQEPTAQNSAADSQKDQLQNAQAEQSKITTLPAPMVAAQQNRGAAFRIAALAYSIFKRQADGSLAPLDPGESIQAGDQLQLRVRPPGGGTLTLSQRKSGGPWRVAAEINRVEPGRSYTLPESAIQIDETVVLRLQLVPQATGAPPTAVEITLTPGQPAAGK